MMKKIFTPLFFFLGALMMNVNAQEGPYLTVYGGYGFPTGSSTELSSPILTDSGAFTSFDTLSWQNLDVTWSLVDIDDVPTLVATATQSNVEVNLGKGIDFGAAFGYMFNDHVGAELGVSYFLGSKSSFTDKFTDATGNTPQVSTLEGSIWATQIRITPSLIVSTDFKDFMPYAKFGLVVGIGTKINEEYTLNDPTGSITGGPSTIQQNFDSKGGLTLGLNAALGAAYMFNKKTGVYIEMVSQTMSYKPKERNINTYTENGVDYLSNENLRQYVRSIEYRDEVNYNSNEAFDPSVPTLMPEVKYAFSSFRLNLGIRFNF